MRRRANQPRWHSFVRNPAAVALIIILFVYTASLHVGFMARSAKGPIFIVRMGAVGVGVLTPQATIQDIPPTTYVGFYRPTIPVLWSVLFIDDSMGTRLYIPLWVPSLLIAALMVWVRIAGRTRPQGVCPACRYNLDGCLVTRCEHCGISTVTCPECGGKAPRTAEHADEPASSP